MSTNASDIRRRVAESEVPLRELGALSGLNYQRICDWKKGWTELKESELAALTSAVTTAIRARVDKFNEMLARIGDKGRDYVVAYRNWKSSPGGTA